MKCNERHNNVFLKKIIQFMYYILRFYLQKLQLLIPHPKLRSLIFRMLGAHVGKSVRIEDAYIGNNTSWGFDNLSIGDFSVVTHDGKLDLTDRIVIGKKTVIAGTLYTHQDAGSYLFESPTVRRFPRKVAPVVIDDHVYIAAGAIILCGVHVGKNSVIGAGSVVISDVPPNTLYAGVPAKCKKTFCEIESM